MIFLAKKEINKERRIKTWSINRVLMWREGTRLMWRRLRPVGVKDSSSYIPPRDFNISSLS